jgi:hypothetical protein
MTLEAGFKFGSNGIYIVENVTVGLLGPGEPVQVLPQLCAIQTIRVNFTHSMTLLGQYLFDKKIVPQHNGVMIIPQQSVPGLKHTHSYDTNILVQHKK